MRTEQRTPDVVVEQSKPEEVVPPNQTSDQAEPEATPTLDKDATVPIEAPPDKVAEGSTSKGNSSAKNKKGKAAASKPPPKRAVQPAKIKEKPEKVEKSEAPKEKKPAKPTVKEKKAAKLNKKKGGAGVINKDGLSDSNEAPATAIAVGTDDISNDTVAVVAPDANPDTIEAVTEVVTSEQTTSDPVTQEVVSDPAAENIVPEDVVVQDPVPESSAQKSPPPKDSALKEPDAETIVPETTILEGDVPQETTSENPILETSLAETSAAETTLPEDSTSKQPTLQDASHITEVPIINGNESSEATSESSVMEAPGIEISVPEAIIQVATVPEVSAPKTSAPEITAPETSSSENSASELGGSQEQIPVKTTPEISNDVISMPNDQASQEAIKDSPSSESAAAVDVINTPVSQNIEEEVVPKQPKSEETSTVSDAEAIITENVSDDLKNTESVEAITKIAEVEAELCHVPEATKEASSDVNDAVSKDIGQETDDTQSNPEISSKEKLTNDSEVIVVSGNSKNYSSVAAGAVNILETADNSSPNPDPDSTVVGETDTIHSVKDTSALKSDEQEKSDENENPSKGEINVAEVSLVPIPAPVAEEVVMTTGSQEAQSELETMVPNSTKTPTEKAVEDKDQDTTKEIHSGIIDETVKAKINSMESKDDDGTAIVIAQDLSPNDSTSALEKSSEAEDTDSQANKPIGKAPDEVPLVSESTKISAEGSKLASTASQHQATPEEVPQVVEAELLKGKSSVLQTTETVQLNGVAGPEPKEESKIESRITKKANDVEEVSTTSDGQVRTISDELVLSGADVAPETKSAETDLVSEMVLAVVIASEEIQKSDADKANINNDDNGNSDSSLKKALDKTDTVVSDNAVETTSQSTIIVEESTASKTHEDFPNQTTNQVLEETNMDNRSIAAVCDDEVNEVIEDNIQPSAVTEVDCSLKSDKQETANINEPPSPGIEPMSVESNADQVPVVVPTAVLIDANADSISTEVINTSRSIEKEQDRKRRKHRNIVTEGSNSKGSSSSKTQRDRTRDSRDKDRANLEPPRQTMESRKLQGNEELTQRQKLSSGAIDEAGQVSRSSRHHKHDSGVHIPGVDVKRMDSKNQYPAEQQPRLRRSRTSRSEKTNQLLPSNQEPERIRRLSNTFVDLTSIRRTLRPKLFDGIRAESEVGRFAGSKAQPETSSPVSPVMPTIRRSRTEHNTSNSRSDRQNDRVTEEAERRKAHDRRKQQAAKNSAGVEADRRQARHEAHRVERERDRLESEEADRAHRKRRGERKKREIPVANTISSGEDGAIISDKRPDVADVVEDMKPEETKEKIERHRRHRSGRPSISHSQISDKDKDRDMQKINRRLSHASGEGRKAGQEGSSREKSVKSDSTKRSGGFFKRIFGN